MRHGRCDLSRYARPSSARGTNPVGSISRYIFRTTMVAFLITLITLTVVIWFTQAMRDFDLITSERQTLFVFVGITGMIVPLLVMIIAPIALMVSARMCSTGSARIPEIIVMNAAGVSPWRLLWPFLAAGCPGFAAGLGHCRLCLAAGAARIARLVIAGARRHSYQYRAARPLHQRQRQSHLPHRRPAAEWPAARHLRRRRRDPHEASHLPRRAGRDRKKRQWLVPRARTRQHPAAGSRPARPAHRDFRPLRFRSVEIHRRPAERRCTRCAKNTSGS